MPDSWVSSNDTEARMATTKPKGWRKFDQLCKKLVQVPKGEVDAKVERDRTKRLAKKKK